LNKSFDKYLTITFPVIDEKEICYVVVKSKYNSPVFLTFEGNEKFFIRTGNSTQPLRPSEMSEHIKTNWIS
jgi:predicted HTH transcriptional regulator